MQNSWAAASNDMSIFWRQLRLVLKKNFILRRRRPVLLAIELLWPAFIFVAVVIVRQITLPKPAQICHYSGKALPSSGILPTLRSFICRPNNECLNESSNDLVFHKRFWSELQPIVRNRRLRSAVEQLPSIVDFVNEYRKLLNDNDLRNLLSSQIKLENVLLKPQKFKRDLVDELGLLSLQAADSLMDSTINATQLLEQSSFPCNSDILNLIIISSDINHASLNETVTAICNLDKGEQLQFLQLLWQSANVSKLFHLASLLPKLVADDQLSTALRNISRLANVLESLAPFFGISNALTSTFTADNWLPNILRLVLDSQDPDIDFAFTTAMLDDLWTLMPFTDKQTWKNLKSLSKSLGTTVEFIRAHTAYTNKSPEWIEILNSAQLEVNAYNLTSDEWTHLLNSSIELSKLPEIYQSKSMSDLKTILCSNRTNALSDDYLQFQCSEKVIKALWKSISHKGINTKRIVRYLSYEKQRQRHGNAKLSDLASISSRLRDDVTTDERIESDSTFMLQSLTSFADNFRLEPLLKQVRSAAASGNWTELLTEGIHVIWTTADASIQESIIWKDLKQEGHILLLEHKWMLSVLDAISGKKLTFGNMLLQPITLDGLITKLAPYLPTIIRADLQGRLKPEQVELLRRSTTQMELRYHYCIDPGYVNLIDFSSLSIDYEMLKKAQDALCRFDLNTLIGELDRTLEFRNFAKNLAKAHVTHQNSKVTKRKFSLVELYQSGMELSTRLQSIGQRWSNTVKQHKVDVKKLQEFAVRSFGNVTVTPGGHSPLSVRKPSLMDLLQLSIEASIDTPVAELFLDTLRTIDEQLQDYFDSVTPNGLAGKMIEYHLTYGPYLEEMVLQTLADVNKTEKLIVISDWTAAFCGVEFHSLFETPPLPKPLDWQLYRHFVCSFDYYGFRQQLIARKRNHRELHALAHKLENFDDYYGNSERHLSTSGNDIRLALQILNNKLLNYSSNPPATTFNQLQNYEWKRPSAVTARFLKRLNKMHIGELTNLMSVGLRALDHIQLLNDKNSNSNDKSQLVKILSEHVHTFATFLRTFNKEFHDHKNKSNINNAKSLNELFSDQPHTDLRPETGFERLLNEILNDKENSAAIHNLSTSQLSALLQMLSSPNCVDADLSNIIGLEKNSHRHKELVQLLCINSQAIQKELLLLKDKTSKWSSNEYKHTNLKDLAVEISKAGENLRKLLTQIVTPMLKGNQNLSATTDNSQWLLSDSGDIPDANSVIEKLAQSSMPESSFNSVFNGFKSFVLFFQAQASIMANALKKLNDRKAHDIIDLLDLPDEHPVKRSIKSAAELAALFAESVLSYNRNLTTFAYKIHENPENFKTFCNYRNDLLPVLQNDPDFESLISETICAEDLQSSIADVQEKYPELIAFGDNMANLISGKPVYSYTVDYSQLWDSLQQLQLEYNRFQSNPQASVLRRARILDPEVWRSLIGRISNKISHVSSRDVRSALTTVAPFTNSYLRKSGFGPSFAAFNYFADGVMQRLRHIDPTETKASELLADLPDLQRLANAVDECTVDLVELVLYSAAENPDEISALLSSNNISMIRHNVCSHPLKYFHSPPHHYVQVEELISKICTFDARRLTLDLIKFVNSPIKGLTNGELEADDLIRQFNGIQRVDVSSIGTKLQELADAVELVKKRNQNFFRPLQLQSFEKQTWAAVGKQYSSYLANAPENVANSLKSIAPLYDAEVSDSNVGTILKPVLNLITTLGAMLHGQVLSLTGHNPLTSFERYSSELKKLDPIIENAGTIVDTVLETAKDNRKAKRALGLLVNFRGIQPEFCGTADLENLVTLPPNDPQARSKLETIQKSICSINADQLRQDLTRYSSSRRNLNNAGKPAEEVITQRHDMPEYRTSDLLSIVSDIQAASKELEQNNGSLNKKLESFLIFGKTPEQWKSVAGNLVPSGGANLKQPITMDQYGITMLSIEAGIQAAKMINEKFPLVRTGIHFADALLTSLQQKLDKIPAGATVTYNALFPRQHTIRAGLEKILPLAPVIFETVLWTSSSPRVIGMAKMDLANRQEIYDRICHPELELSQILFHPTLLPSDWKALKEALCFVAENFYSLERELEHDLNAVELRRKIENQESVEWPQFTETVYNFGEKVRHLQNTGTVIEPPDGEYIFSETWNTAASNWFSAQTDANWHLDSLYEQLLMLEDVASTEPLVKEYISAARKLVKTTNEALLKFQEAEFMLPLQDLLPDKAPVLKRWLLESVQMSPQLADAMLNSRIVDEGKLFKLFDNTELIFKLVCEHGSSGIESVIQVPGSVKASELEEFLCKTLNKEMIGKLFSDLQQMLQLNFDELRQRIQAAKRQRSGQSAFSEIDSQSRKSTVDESTMVDELNNLAILINRMLRSSTAIELPEAVADQWNELLKKTISKMSSASLERLPSLVKSLESSLQKLLPKFRKTEFWKSIQSYVVASRNAQEQMNWNSANTINSEAQSNVVVSVLNDPHLTSQQIRKEFELTPQQSLQFVQSIDARMLTTIAAMNRYALNQLFCDVDVFGEEFSQIDRRLVPKFIEVLCRADHQRLQDVLLNKTNSREYLNQLRDASQFDNHEPWKNTYKTKLEFLKTLAAKLSPNSRSRRFYDQFQRKTPNTEQLQDNVVSDRKLMDAFANLKLAELQRLLHTADGALSSMYYTREENLTELKLLLNETLSATTSCIDAMNLQQHDTLLEFSADESLSCFLHEMERLLQVHRQSNSNGTFVAGEKVPNSSGRFRIPSEMILMRDPGTNEPVDLWPEAIPDKSRHKWLVESLKSLSIVLAGTGTWQKILTYGNAITALGRLLKGQLLMDKDITAPIEWSLYDHSEYGIWLKDTYELSALLVQEFLRSGLNLTLVLEHGTRTLCDGYSLNSVALHLPVGSTVRRELELLICHIHYPAIVDELNRQIDLRKIFVQTFPPLAVQPSVDWDEVAEYLYEMTQHEQELRKLWPEYDATLLLEIDADIGAVLMDWSHHHARRQETKLSKQTATEILQTIAPELSISNYGSFPYAVASEEGSEVIEKLADAMQVVANATDHRSKLLQHATIKLRDMLKDLTITRQILQSTVGLGEAALDLLLNADINITELGNIINAENPREILCSRPLNNVFIVSDYSSAQNSQNYSRQQLFDAICAVDTKRLVSEIDESLDPRNLVREMEKVWRNGNLVLDNMNWNQLFRNTKQFFELLSANINPSSKHNNLLNNFDFPRTLNSFQKFEASDGHKLLNQLVKLGMRIPDAVLENASHSLSLWSQIKAELKTLDQLVSATNLVLHDFAEKRVSLEDVLSHDFLLEDLLQRTSLVLSDSVIGQERHQNVPDSELDLSSLYRNTIELQRLLSRLKDGQSWSVLLRKLLDTLSSLNPEFLDRLVSEMQQIFSSLDDTYASSEFFGSSYRNLKQGIMTTIKRLQRHALTPSSAVSDRSHDAPFIDEHFGEMKMTVPLANVVSFAGFAAATQFDSSTSLRLITKRSVPSAHRTRFLDACQRSFTTIADVKRPALLNALKVAGSLALQLPYLSAYRKLVCDVSQLPLQETYDRILHAFAWIFNEVTSDYSSDTDTICATFLETLTGIPMDFSFSDIISKQHGFMEELEQMSSCLKNGNFQSARTLDRYLEIIADAATIADKGSSSAELQGLFEGLEHNIPDIRDDLPSIFTEFTANICNRCMYPCFIVFVEFTRYLISPATFTSDLIKLCIDQEVRIALLESEIDLNILSRIRSASELAEYFCHLDKFQKLFKISKTRSAVGAQSLSESLYQHETMLTSVFLKAFDFYRIQSDLPSLMQQRVQDNKWISSVTHKIQNTVPKALELVQSSKDFYIDPMDILGDKKRRRRAVEKFYNIFFENKLERSQEVFATFLEQVREISLSASVSDMLEDILNGLSAVNSTKHIVTSVLEQQYPLLKIVPEIFDIGRKLFDSDVVESLSTSTVNPYKLIKLTTYGNLSLIVCDPMELSQILSNSSMDPLLLSQRLCPLLTSNKVSSEVVELSKLLNRFSLKEFLVRYAEDSLSSLYAKVRKTRSNIVQDEVLEINFLERIRKVSEFSTKLTSIGGLLKQEVQNIEDEPQLQGIRRLFCGGSLSYGDSVADIFNGAYSESVADVQSSLEEEKSCKNLYRTVRSLPYGEVMWRKWLKPLMRGIIAVAPNNAVTRSIIKQANSTFEELGSWLQFVGTINKVPHSMENASFAARSDEMFNQSFVRVALNSLMGNMADGLLEILSGNRPLLNKESAQLQRLSRAFSEIAECITVDRFRFFDSEEKMLQIVPDLIEEGSLFGAVVFLESTVTTEIIDLPKVIRYKIRMQPDLVPRTDEYSDRLWTAFMPNSFSSDVKYSRGFLLLQDIIDSAILKAMAIQKNGLEFSMPAPLQIKQLPNPFFTKDKFMMILKYWLAMFMFAAWILSAGLLAKSYVHETDEGLLQYMRIMGLCRGVQWLAWFLTSLIVMLVIAISILLMLKFGSITPLSSWSLLVVILTLFIISLIMLSYLISVFFKQATLAALAAVIIYLTSYIPFIVISVAEGVKIPYWLTLLSSLSSSTAFSFACTYVALFEELGVGASWNLVATSPVPGDQMNCFIACLMMLLDSILYGLLALFFSNILPLINMQKDALEVTKANCPGSAENQKRRISGATSAKVVVDATNELFVAESEYTLRRSRPIGISMCNLSKWFRGAENPAVTNLNLNFYEGQITGFLGTNGAGKTTTINLLMGACAPSCGEAFIYGLDAQMDFQKLQKIVGFCPQYNVLFDRLTVREHLEFYASLKATLSNGLLAAEVDRSRNCFRTLEDSDLLSKQHEVVGVGLSGGMKRRLCVAIAFVAGSKTVILDEPTAGIDPLARRKIWDLITRHKKGRTVMLCTHHLDEADILCDRVAIIDQGKLLCSGSPAFLRQQFGSGYRLTLSRALSNDPGPNKPQILSNTVSKLQCYLESWNQTQLYSGNKTLDKVPGECSILSHVRQFIPEAFVLQDYSSELTICLPATNYNCSEPTVMQHCQEPDKTGSITCCHDLEKTGSVTSLSSWMSSIIGENNCETICPRIKQISALLKWLKERKQQLGLAEFGISDCSLEEVFLNVCRQRITREKRGVFNMSLSRDGNLATNGKIYGSSCALEDTMSIYDEPEDVSASKCASTEIINGHNSRHTGTLLKLQQFGALLEKRFTHSRRNFKLLISGLLLPCVFVALAMGCHKIKPLNTNLPLLPLYADLVAPGSSIFVVDDKATPVVLGHLVPNLTANLDCRYKQLKSCKSPLPYSTGSSFNISLNDCHCNGARQGRFPVSKSLLQTSSISIDDFSEVSQAIHLNCALLHSSPTYPGVRLGGISWQEADTSVAEHTEISSKIPNTLTLWYNQKASHSLPTLLNLASNIRLQHLNASADFGILTYSHPFPYSQQQLQRETVLQRIGDVGIATVLLCAFSFVPASLTIYLVQERITKQKQLQALAGIGPLMYWSVALLWDFILYLFTVLFGIGIILACGIDVYTANLNITAVAALLALFGWSCIPLMYLAQRFFNDAPVAYIVLFCCSVFLGINTMVPLLLLSVFEPIQSLLELLNKVFLVCPQFCLTDGLVQLAKAHVRSQLSMEFRFAEIRSSFGDPFNVWDNIGIHCLALFLTGALFFLLNLLLEYFECGCVKTKHQPHQTPDVNQLLYQDDDVVRERCRVIQAHLSEDSNDVLQVVGLSKQYRNILGTKKALNNVYFGVSEGECFGLLGTNGAGKSTTFQILTGGSSPSSGDVLFRNKSLRNLTGISSIMDIGYCPQEDPCDCLLTAKEILNIQAKILGFPSSIRQKVVDTVILQHQLQDYCDNIVQTYSGGTRRKLATALALIGRPGLVLMDEPTSGMDPESRRLTWKLIADIVKEGRSVVLTSHSMEECDYLCTRLAIMVNGEICCIGTLQHLKKKFGQGYTVRVKATNQQQDMALLRHVIEESFPDAFLKSIHASTLEFVVPQSDADTVVNLFTVLEKMKGALGVEDYAVMQTSLDQVFMDLTNQQQNIDLLEGKSQCCTPRNNSVSVPINTSWHKCTPNVFQSAPFHNIVRPELPDFVPIEM